MIATGTVTGITGAKFGNSPSDYGMSLMEVGSTANNQMFIKNGGSNGIIIDNSPTSNYGLWVRNSGIQSGYTFHSAAFDGGVFSVKSIYNQQVNDFVVKDSKIGIGTDNPSVGKMQIYGNGSANGLALFTTANTNANPFTLYQDGYKTYFTRNAENAKGFSMDENGNVTFANTVNVGTGNLLVNNQPVVGSQWTTNGTAINYAAGNIGVGTATI